MDDARADGPTSAAIPAVARAGAPLVVLSPQYLRTMGSSRYRVYYPADELRRLGVEVRLLGPRGRGWPLRRRQWDDIPGVARVVVPGRPRVLVLQKARSRVGECVAAALARASGARVVLDFDDPVRVRAATPVLLRLATHLVVGHPGLLEGIAVPRRTKVAVIPTPLPVASYDQDEPTGELLVVWLGSPEWAPPMVALAEAISGGEGGATVAATFRIVGTDDATGDPPSEAVVCVPASRVDWGDERAVARQLADASVGLAPDRGTAGTGFKVLQYLAAGCLPLVERSSPGAAYLADASAELVGLCLVDDFDIATVAAAIDAIERHRSQQPASFEALVTECRRLARAWDVGPFCHQWLQAVGVPDPSDVVGPPDR